LNLWVKIMRFRATPILYSSGVTPRRLKIAEKRLQRQRDKWALFPEYWPKQTAEEDIREGDRLHIELQIKHRIERAHEWIKARKLMRDDHHGKEYYEYWQTCSYPADPERLLGIIKDGYERLLDIKRELNRARFLGKLTTETIQNTEKQRDGESYKDAFFRRLRAAREKAERLHPELFVNNK